MNYTRYQGEVEIGCWDQCDMRSEEPPLSVVRPELFNFEHPMPDIQLITDENRIKKFLRLLIEPGQVFEIRALDVKHGYGVPFTIAGFFDYEHIDAAAMEIVGKCGEARGVYITMNPCQPALLARRMNRMERAGKDELTGNHEIEKRCWLIIDLDPKRPSGICATDEEKALAIELREKVQHELSSDGWPDPIVVDSGNGQYLLYRIELPTDDNKLIERALKGLKTRFDTDCVHVDTSMHNAARSSAYRARLTARATTHPHGRIGWQNWSMCQRS